MKGAQKIKRRGKITKLEIPIIYLTRNKTCALPKSVRGRQHSHRLVHDPLANAEIVIDPFLEVFVIGDLVSVETRAVRTPRGPDQDAGKQISFSPSTPSPPTGPFAFKSSRVQGIFTLNQSSA